MASTKGDERYGRLSSLPPKLVTKVKDMFGTIRQLLFRALSMSMFTVKTSIIIKENCLVLVPSKVFCF